MSGKSNSMVMDRIGIHGSDEYRNAVLCALDANLVRGGNMREAIIIGTILILAVIVWHKPRKGGRR